MKAKILAAILVSASVASLQAQTTIINYSTGGTNVPGYTGYFNTNDGWTMTNWAGQQGWTGTGVGASSAVQPESGISPGGTGDQSGSLGIVDVPTGAVATLEHAFTPMSPLNYSNITVSYIAEFSLADILPPNGNNDSFVFDLQNSSKQSLLNLTLKAPGQNPGFDYTLSSLGTVFNNEFDMDFNYVYRMQIDLTGTNWSGTLYGVTDPSGVRTMTNLGSFDGGILANGGNASDFANTAVRWELETGDTNDPGYYGLFVNEVTIQSEGEPIPEPGTWAMGALLLGGAAFVVYRRRKASVAVA